jgi:DNA repair exonuclease SbcCD ATPase subunit
MMANKPSTPQNQEYEDLRKQLDWLDEERRKSNRKLSEMEQKVELQQREIVTRDQRIKLLEEQISKFSSQISRIPQIDVQLTQFKDEIVQLIEQYDQRRVQAHSEMEAMRRVEHESNVREIADVRKELPAIGRLQRDMELRQAEETRLANLIGQQQNKFSTVVNRVDSWENALAFLEEKEKQTSRNLNEVQTQMVDINKRWAPITDRIDVVASNLNKLDGNTRMVVEAQKEIRESTKGWMEQIQIGEYERNQKLENWRQRLDEQTKIIEQFSREWVTFSDQYKEAKMAVQTLAPWQAQIEQQQRDTAELLRVEAHRMQSQWDNFTLESDKKWRSFDVELEQRWSAFNRNLRQISEQLIVLEEALKDVNQDKETLWRVQTAQADALKQLPRMWLEEVEKAVNQNPNRRRQPALVPIREE